MNIISTLIIITNIVGILNGYSNSIYIRKNAIINSFAEINRLERIKEKGTMTVASPLGDTTFVYIDSDTNKISGIDADITNEIASRLKINKVETKQLLFGELLEKLNTDDNIDIATGGIFITPEREKLVAFTQPLYQDSEAIIVPTFSKINFKKDLEDALVGVEKGTIFVELAQRWKEDNLIKDIVIFDTTSELLDAVNNEKVAAGIVDSVSTKYLLLKNKNIVIRILKDYTPELSETVGIAVRKNDTILLKVLNEKIDEMKSDGALYSILVKNGLDKNNMIGN